MDTDRKWVVVRIDGKIAALSTDYKALAGITARIASQKSPLYDKVCAETVDFEYVWKLRSCTAWEDLMLFGTEFQKRIWRKLWDLTHAEEYDSVQATEHGRLLSYTDFADLCDNRAGVRAVAHAIALNPVPVIIPCHLVVPKEAIDRISEIHRKAESTIFRGNDLCLESILLDPAIDFGEYALGKELKRKLISLDLAGQR